MFAMAARKSVEFHEPMGCKSAVLMAQNRIASTYLESWHDNVEEVILVMIWRSIEQHPVY